MTAIGLPKQDATARFSSCTVAVACLAANLVVLAFNCHYDDATAVVVVVGRKTIGRRHKIGLLALHCYTRCGRCT